MDDSYFWLAVATIVIAIVVLLVISNTHQDVPQACGKSFPRPPDVSPSHTMWPGKYPWVSYFTGAGVYGTLVDQKWIVTSASASEAIAVGSIVVVGTYDASKSESIPQARFVDVKVKHPQYDAASGRNNIALVRINPGARISPCCLPTVDGVGQQLSLCGRLVSKPGVVEPLLVEWPVTVAKCDGNGQSFCVAPPACGQFEGSGVFNDSNGTIVGIVTVVDRMCSAPTQCQSVFPHIQWIMLQIKNE